MVGKSSPFQFVLVLFALMGVMTPGSSLARPGKELDSRQDVKTQESGRRVDTPDGAPFDPLTDVKRVHVMFCHHLDVGLDIGLKLTEDCVGFATKIVQRYFDVFIPRAIKLAQEVRATGSKNRFAYTMHPWILSLYVDCDPWKIEDGCPLNPGTLRCPSQAEVAAFDEAVLRGDILWAASPMNLDPGIVGSPTLFKELLSISEGLDARYNLTKISRVWSNVDVPGFVRSAIPLLVQSGVKFLSVGANARGAFPNGSYPINEGSSPWQTVGNNFSTMFRWRDSASAEEIVVMYHRSYGSNFKLSGGGGFFPNTSLISESSGTALASYFRSDNTGPPASIAEINSIFKTVQEQFPAAKEVFGSTMDAFAAEVSDEDIARMPLLQHEWGDQWIGGLQTDPWRIQVYREMVRLREECIGSGDCKPESKGLRNMTRWLAKISEHTQGVQNEGWSPGVPGCMAADGSFQSPCTTETNKHWSNTEFEKIHNAEHNLFTGADLSWIEARKFNDLAIGALEAQVSSDSGARRLVGMIKQQLPQLRPAVPSLVGLNQASLSSLGEIDLRCGGMEMNFDNRSGAITHLRFGSLGAPSWAAADHQLMDLRYMTYNDRANLTCNESGCPNPVAGSWRPNLVTLHHNCSTSKSTDFAQRDCQSCHVIVKARWNDTLAGGKYGSASEIVTEYVLMPSNPPAAVTYPAGDGRGLGVVSVVLKLFNKTTTRLPESTVLLFQPRQPQPQYGWAMDVLGGWVDPYDVLAGGQQWAHAIWNGVKYTTDQGTTSSGLHIDSLDAAMACPMIAQWNFSSHSSGCTDPAGCSLIDDGSESVCDSNGLNGAGGQQQLNRTAGCPTAHSCRSFGVGGMAFQLHSNRMGISGFAQWYPFGIEGKGTYQKEDENILYRFSMSERT